MNTHTHVFAESILHRTPMLEAIEKSRDESKNELGALRKHSASPIQANKKNFHLLASAEGVLQREGESAHDITTEIHRSDASLLKMKGPVLRDGVSLWKKLPIAIILSRGAAEWSFDVR